MRKIRPESLKEYFSVPEWAEDIAIEVAKRNGMPIPRIRWHEKPDGGRGWCYHDKARGITLSVSPSMSREARTILLIHELTHYVLPIDLHHSEKFYEKMYSECRIHGVDTLPVYFAERDYKVAAIVVGAKLMALELSGTPLFDANRRAAR